MPANGIGIGNEKSSTNGARTVGIHPLKNEAGPPTSHQTQTLTRIKNLNVKSSNYKTRRKPRSKFLWPQGRQWLLRYNTKSQVTEEKYKLDFININWTSLK